MGYMGLRNWGESDMAAGLVHCIFDDVLKQLREVLKEETSCFNTDGVVNVGLFLEMLQDIDCNLQEFINDEFVPAMEAYISQSDSADWDDEDNKKMHLKAYRRMLRHAEKLSTDYGHATN